MPFPFSRLRSSSLCVAPALILAFGLAQCGGAGQEATAPPGAADPVAASDEGMRAFYEQDISFGRCAPFATTDGERATFASGRFECGRLEVPLDYAKPGGRTAQIAVLRARARGKAIGSLVVNPGGPGATGTSFAALIADGAKRTPVAKRFDIVGFDPRGTGASTPSLDCFDDAERDDDAVVIPFIAGGERYTEADTRALAERCTERSGGADVLANAGTRNVARDLDVLRAALGDERLTYLGDSWGTRLGAVYAEMYTDKVRAMVLDGGLDPTTDWSARALTQFTSFQQSFEALAKACAETPECPLGTDPAKATERFRSLVGPLEDRPLPARTLTADGSRRTGERRVLTLRAALDGVLAGLYDQKSWPLVIQGLRELEAGRGDVLLFLRDGYHRRNGDGSYPNFLESTTAVYCADEDRLDPEQATAMRGRILDAAPFIDVGQPRETRDGCEHWPAEPTLGFPYADDVEGLAQPLVVSVTGDPATPYQDGVRLAEHLGAGLLSVDGNKHGVTLIEGNDCIDGVIADYLTDLRQPAADARCAL